MHDIRSYLETLAAQAHPLGGWGYAPGQEAHLEPTCLALLALALEPERFQSSIARGREALGLFAAGDGSYVLSRGRPEAIWPTALVLFVQASLGNTQAQVEQTAARLLALSGRVPDDPRTAELHDIDYKLLGWAWGEGNFSWAEPTAWACLALRRAGQGSQPRVEEGLRLLLDRAQDTGGINYGNRRVLGKLTDPIPGPTAIMLLALQGVRVGVDGRVSTGSGASTLVSRHVANVPEGTMNSGPETSALADRPPAPPRMTAAADYLQQQALAGDDLEHLAWGKLALDAWNAAEQGLSGNGTGPIDRSVFEKLDACILEAHRARAATSWLRPAPLRQALTALALAANDKNFFRLTAAGSSAATVAAATPSVRRPSLPQRFKSAMRRLAIEAAGNLRPVAPRSAVHIASITDYNADLAGLLARQFEAFRAQVPLAGKRVVLKPNLVEYHRDKVINTHPNMVAAVIELCRREGAAEVIVAEGPGHWRNVEYLVTASGLGDVLRHYQVSFIDLNHDEPIRTLNLGRLTGMEYLYLSRTVATAEVLISLPKLKTHHWAGATLSLKNLFGTLPGICYGWPKNELHWRGIDQSIVDIALTRTPDLAIVDGIVGMEGDGPLNGTPLPLGAVIMGRDLLAVDATCCRLMQLNPERVGYLALGQRKKLGLLHSSVIDQIGETVESLAKPFETLPQFHELYLGRPA